MNLTITDGIRINSAAMSINIPIKNWTAKLSYIVCRGLVDKGILPGKAVIGIYRKRVFNSSDITRPDGYAVVYTNYGWIDAGDDGLIDPCNWSHSGSEKILLQATPSDAYCNAIDPCTITSKELPIHYSSDELYAIRRGLHKEAFCRLLNYKVEVPGLTMAEVAYLAARNIDELGSSAKMLYEFLIINNLSSLIPLKNVKKLFPQIAKAAPYSFYIEDA